MVYYGKLSQGCERCRKRKVKCGLQKPECQRCVKGKARCPGYRNMGDVLFRDESARVIRKSQTAYEHGVMPRETIAAHISQPPEDVGAQFYFSNFTCGEPPLSEEHRSWLQTLYFTSSKTPFTAAVEAVGMVALANVYYAPDIAAAARQRYWKALIATKEALHDPHQSVADSTLMAVLSLGTYEFISLESIDQYRSWATHTEGATALLKLRGNQQFRHKRGRELFVQLKQQILYYCFQQFQAAPVALLELNQEFEASISGGRAKGKHSESLSNMCFRVLNMLASRGSNSVSAIGKMYTDAITLTEDLARWREALPHSWQYATIIADDNSSGVFFKGQIHSYGNPWIEQAWNTWRALQIPVSKVIVELRGKCVEYEESRFEAAQEIIRSSSTNICISAPNLMDSPRAATLVWPLMVISQEDTNPQEERVWAAKLLHRIGSTMGIRPATLLANTISKGPEVFQPPFPSSQCLTIEH